MSEYCYCEFRAIDRPLDAAEKAWLRTLSSRARITSTSFSNLYEWGDFHGDPKTLVEHCFDLHLHFSHWGTRRLMIRLPRRLVDLFRFDPALLAGDLVEVTEAGEHLILDIHRQGDGEEYEDHSGGDDTSWLDTMAPLRADLLSGDWRLIHLLWLRELAEGNLEDDAEEPSSGMGPLNRRLETFAEFFRIDPDLLRAAAEVLSDVAPEAHSAKAIWTVVASLPETEKTDLLHRLYRDDPHAGAALRLRVGARFSLTEPIGRESGRYPICAPAPKRSARRGRLPRRSDGRPSAFERNGRRKRSGASVSRRFGGAAMPCGTRSRPKSEG